MTCSIGSYLSLLDWPVDATAGAATCHLRDTQAVYRTAQRGLKLGAFAVRLCLSQALLRTATRLFGPRLIDLLGVFGSIGQDGHTVIGHFQEAAGDEDGLLRVTQANGQFAGIQHR